LGAGGTMLGGPPGGGGTTLIGVAVFGSAILKKCSN